MDIGSIRFSIDADTSDLPRAEASMEDLREQARRTAEQTEKLGDNVTRAGRKTRTATQQMERGFRSTETAAGRASASIDRLQNMMHLLAGALVLREVVQYSDAWNNAANQLRQVTTTTEELIGAQETLLGIANETRTGFASTANLYSRLARSTTELGLSTGELYDITETINKSFAVSGATAEEASAAITQLSQGLAAGALRGDEFNSVAEQAPGIMRAIASSLNMTIGDLREFAAEGGITAEIVVNALQGASDTIDGAFSRSVATFGQRMTVASNNLMEFVGTSDSIQGAVDTFARVVQGASEVLAEHSTELDIVIAAAGAGAAAYGTLTAATLALRVAQSGLNNAMRANPLLLLVSAGAAAAGALYAVRDATVTLGDTTASVTEWMKGTWTVLSNILSTSFVGATQQAAGAFGQFGEIASDVGSYLWETFKALMENIAGISKTVINGVIAYWQTFGEVVGIAAQTAYSQFVNSFQNILTVAKGFWKDIQAVLSGDFSFTNFRSAVQASFVNPLADASDEVRAAFDRNFGRDYLGETVEYIAEGIEGVGESIAATVSAGQSFKSLDSWLFQVGDTAGGAAGGMKALGGATKEAKKEAEEFQRNLNSLLDTLFPVQAAAREYAANQDLLTKAYMEGSLAQDKYLEGMERLEESTQSAQKASEVYDILGEKTKETADFAEDMGMTFSSAFEDAIIKGGDFREILAGVAEDIARITLRQSITEPAGNWIASAISGAMGGGMGAGTFGGGGVGMPLGYADGGYTGPGAKMDPAGIVHAGEFVVKKSIVDQPGMLQALNNLNQGYANGGHVGGSRLAAGDGEGEAPQIVYAPNINVRAEKGMEDQDINRQVKQYQKANEAQFKKLLDQNMRPGGAIYNFVKRN